MPDIKQDLLSLQYSQNFTIDGLQEANVDLSLPPAGAAAATVYGVVTDGTAPIADATVKLFDSTGMPYRHVLTDAAGAYSFSDIPTGTYSLGAVKEGYLLSDAAGVTLSSGATAPECIPLYLPFVNLHIKRFGFRQYGHRCSRRMHTSLSFGGRNSLHAMHPRLIFQCAIHLIAGNTAYNLLISSGCTFGIA